MPGRVAVPAGIALALCSPVQALACPVDEPLQPSALEASEVVIVGRLTDHHFIPSKAARDYRKWDLAHSPDLEPNVRRILESETRFPGDHMHLRIAVDEVLKGRSEKIVQVRWDDFSESQLDAMKAGPHIIGLKSFPSRFPQFQGLWVKKAPAFRLGALAIVQGRCSPPFILDTHHGHAMVIRKILRG